MKKTLYLTLKKKQFEVTFSGEKKFEFRRPSKWIESRLIDKTYEVVKFTNGYGSDKPYFICLYLGWELAKPNTHTYSNGLIVSTTNEYFQINLGEIIEYGNIK